MKTLMNVPRFANSGTSRPVLPGRSGYGGENSEKAIEMERQWTSQNQYYIQGFSASVSQGTSQDFNLRLNSAGRFHLGVSIMSEQPDGSDLVDIRVNYSINSNQSVNNVSALLMNPGVADAVLFFPIPQPLNGNDNIRVQFVKDNAGTVEVVINVFYFPQVGL